MKPKGFPVPVLDGQQVTFRTSGSTATACGEDGLPEAVPLRSPQPGSRPCASLQAAVAGARQWHILTLSLSFRIRQRDRPGDN